MQVVRDYTFTRLIGKGGFSKVYLVTNSNYQQEFVAKVMSYNRFQSESQSIVIDAEIHTLMQLNHPNIIRLYDHFIEGQNFYLILEYCPNGSLHEEIVERKEKMSKQRFITIAKQVLSALFYCHTKNIAHRDIKLANILLDEYNRAKLADFGISFQIEDGKLSSSFVGTSQFESPEIMNKQPHDPIKADIWALGVTFATMANNRSPWIADTSGKLKQQVTTGKYQLRKSIDPDIRDLISHMIVVDPNERWTAGKLLQHSIFIEIPSLQVAQPLSIPDALSPHGRQILSPRSKQQIHSPNSRPMSSHGSELVIVSSRNGIRCSPRIELSAPKKVYRSLMIYKMNAENGVSVIPKIKPRFHSKHVTPSKTFS